MFRFQIYDNSGDYLESQRWWIFSILMTVGGFLGGVYLYHPRRRVL